MKEARCPRDFSITIISIQIQYIKSQESSKDQSSNQYEDQQHRLLWDPRLRFGGTAAMYVVPSSRGTSLPCILTIVTVRSDAGLPDVQADYRRQEIQPDYKRQEIQPDYKRQEIKPDYKRQEIKPDYKRQEIQPDY
jgi:hypothetical protein